MGRRAAPMTAIEDFERLCDPASPAELSRLRRRLPTHVDVVAEASLIEPTLAVQLATRIAERLGELADHSGTLAAEERSWVRGAMAYFLLTGDANPDLAGPHGLDDDREVLNEVCRRLGRTDLIIA
jgi:hypothetical protein